jgi:hypothetical protein
MMDLSDTFSDYSESMNTAIENTDTDTNNTNNTNTDSSRFVLFSHQEQRLDEIFRELKPLYLKSIQNNLLYGGPFNNKLRELLGTEPNMTIPQNTILAYLVKKTFGSKPFEYWSTLKSFTSKLGYLIREYLYFGVCPTLASMQSSELGFVSVGEQNFVYNYFVWTREGDNAVNNPPSDIGITEGNYEQYRKNRTQGWSKQQLQAFVSTNVIPELLEITDLNIALTNRYYHKKTEIKTKHSLNLITILYMHFHAQFFNATVGEIMKSHTQGNVTYREVLRRLNQYYNTLGLANNEIYLLKKCGKEIFEIYVTLHLLKRKRLMYLNQKLRKHVTAIGKPHRNPETVRFHWQKLCRPTSLQRAFNLDELRDLAAFEGIPEYLFQTKAELCTELAQRFERVIQGKAKVIPKCINTTSLMLTDLEDIPAEFFYSYIHNNKIYCDDIRDLYRHFQTQGAKHPIDRTPVSQRLVRNVDIWYHKLLDTTVTMDDLFTEPEPVWSVSSLLTAKAAEFVSQLNYPNDLTYFTNADLSKTTAFVDELVLEGIMYPAERARLNVITDATQYKLLLIDILLLKFLNDPAQIRLENGQVLSSLAINTSNVYNTHFYRDTR